MKKGISIKKDDTLFGFERLCSLIDQNHRLDAEGIKNAILIERQKSIEQ